MEEIGALSRVYRKSCQWKQFHQVIRKILTNNKTSAVNENRDAVAQWLPLALYTSCLQETDVECKVDWFLKESEMFLAKYPTSASYPIVKMQLQEGTTWKTPAGQEALAKKRADFDAYLLSHPE